MSASVDFGFDVTDPRTYWSTVKTVVGAAFGTGTPAEQIVAAFVLGVVAAGTTVVGFVTGVLVALFAWFVLLPIGVLRLWDPINARWPL